MLTVLFNCNQFQFSCRLELKCAADSFISATDSEPGFNVFKTVKTNLPVQFSGND